MESMKVTHGNTTHDANQECGGCASYVIRNALVGMMVDLGARYVDDNLKFPRKLSSGAH